LRVLCFKSCNAGNTSDPTGLKEVIKVCILVVLLLLQIQNGTSSNLFNTVPRGRKDVCATLFLFSLLILFFCFANLRRLALLA
jgi:hypothetical protein